MFKKLFILSFAALSLNISPCFAESSSDKDPLTVGNYGSYDLYEKEVIMVPNMSNSRSVKLGIGKSQNPSEAYLDAHELRLKVRELSSQLLEAWSPSNLSGMVAYITSFTPQDNPRAETSFGQYLREATMYEFNQRGFLVRDFSHRDLILNEGGFAFGISDEKYKTSVKRNKAAIVTGTFYRDRDYLFVNARLIRGTDGMVLRTAQTVLPVTPLVGRMTKERIKPKPPRPLFPETTRAMIHVVPGE